MNEPVDHYEVQQLVGHPRNKDELFWMGISPPATNLIHYTLTDMQNYKHMVKFLKSMRAAYPTRVYRMVRTSIVIPENQEA